MRVRTPVEGFGGYVAGVTFVSGEAEVPDDHPALAYFRRQGYMIDEPEPKPEPEPEPEPEPKPKATRARPSR